jgi:hypothetical protein
MKNKKSPLKFGGVATTAAGALGTQNLIGRLGGLFGRGRGNMSRHTGVGGLGEQYAGVGSRPANVVDAGAQFDPTAMQHMQGMFGDISGRQATLGASGIFALEKHLSPVNNEDDGVWAPGEADAAFDKMKYTTDANIRKGAGADLGTIKSTSSDLTAYKSPNPPFDPTSEDDGAGGKEYDTN